MKTYVLDEAGNPRPEPDLAAWGRWFGANERNIAHDIVGGVSVSTVFLALDHSFGKGPPMLYETMIFGGAENGYQDRYATRDEAMAGHARTVQMLKS